MKIEVYEWKEGELRPGSDHVHRNVCLEILDVPSDATAPVRGNILRLRLPVAPIQITPFPRTRIPRQSASVCGSRKGDMETSAPTPAEIPTATFKI